MILSRCLGGRRRVGGEFFEGLAAAALLAAWRVLCGGPARQEIVNLVALEQRPTSGLSGRRCQPGEHG